MKQILDWLARKLDRIAIRGLMKYIVISMGAVFVLDIVFTGQLSSLLLFSKVAILSGQIWRLLTFIFLPPGASLLFILFALYFYYMIGEALESAWGTARFNLFYLVGIASTIVAGMITGYATNQYLNLSLFFAFAILYPEVELRLFMILPVKVKWLAWVNAAFFLYMLVISSWPQRIALLISLANIALFFWPDLYNRIHNWRRRRDWQSQFRR
ncbi:MAG: rhomboid family intramembrane serine protease [Ruminococcaceae bacterium]|nr:rhomboid family intramembrane serine protease [Oscillospiraceae bacterium]